MSPLISAAIVYAQVYCNKIISLIFYKTNYHCFLTLMHQCTTTINVPALSYSSFDIFFPCFFSYPSWGIGPQASHFAVMLQAGFSIWRQCFSHSPCFWPTRSTDLALELNSLSLILFTGIELISFNFYTFSNDNEARIDLFSYFKILSLLYHGNFYLQCVQRSRLNSRAGRFEITNHILWIICYGSPVVDPFKK